MYPTQTCRDRVHLGGRGPCVRFSNGKCNWASLICPVFTKRACGPNHCDLPVPSEWLCPDGKTVARFTCVSDANNQCGATYEPCRGAALKPPPAQRPPPAPRPPPKPCPDPLPSDRELLKWDVAEMCGPGSGPDPPPIKEIKVLRDGTRIIESLGRCVRARYTECHTKCLPGDTRIATPTGDVRVRELRVGDPIYSRDANGRRIATTVARVGAAPIHGVHHVARVVLADGRTLVASPEHPVLGGLVQQLRVGDAYDGSAIKSITLERYAHEHTYDVVPAGGDVYWADDVPILSTLGR